MHWVIQDGFFNETGMNDLVDLLARFEIPHTIVKVVPFVGEIIPDLELDGNVICFGSYSMRHTAKKKNWYPGVFDLEDVCERLYTTDNKWTPHFLNNDSYQCRFDEVGLYADHMGYDLFFMRPVSDSKVFAGNVFEIGEYWDWRKRVVDLEEDDGTSLRAGTEVMVSRPKNIQSEYRLFVVNDRIVTASQYKINDRVQYSKLVDDDILKFGQQLINEQHLADAYCLDLCRASDSIKIVEVNTINSAGFYHARVNDLIIAFEDMFTDS
ncbi:MAG: hypothetical protein CTY12_00820 [Methylotenera sp.]|nr:MAG: hypothetical protein CTY12_00820 [Methylotenera sp.]